MYLAGLYKIINNEKFFSIITKSADERISYVHNRMPVILYKEDIYSWLNDDKNYSHFFDKSFDNLVLNEI